MKWFTKERMDLINEDNIKKYDKYYKSCTIKNSEVVSTTFKTYKSNFYQFLCFLAVNYNNIDLYSDEFMSDAVDIMENYMAFCQDILLNGKKTINNKLAAVSTFFMWSLKRGLISTHPFDNKLDRMKFANDEKIINSYFLTHEQVEIIRNELKNNTKEYDIQDQILFEVAVNSANRIGSLERLTLSSLDIDNMMFVSIREKRAKYVEVMFEDYAKELIIEWLEMRKEDFDKLKIDSLLITYYGGKYSPMTRGVIHYRVRNIGKIIGLEDLHAHCLRKTSLNLVYEDTGDLMLAQKLGNHADAGTTAAFYIKPATKAELREKINALKAKNKSKLDDE